MRYCNNVISFKDHEFVAEIFLYPLANYFGLEELMEELKTIQTKSDPSLFTLRKKAVPEIVYLHFGKKKYRGYKEEPFEIRKSNLTRIPESTIAKYFSGN